LSRITMNMNELEGLSPQPQPGASLAPAHAAAPVKTGSDDGRTSF
jgi:hypothetical protein